MVAATRLDRLISLLETGSTAAVKQTAAQQLGQIAALRVRGTAGSGTDQHATAAPSTAPSAAKKESSPAPASSEAENASDKSASYVGIDGDWHEALYLLAKVLPHLRSKSWDTRVAAATAVEVILRGAGVWDPTPLLAEQDADGDVKMAKKEEQGVTTPQPAPAGELRFETFSLSHLLATGNKLLASAGKEYTLPTGSVAERLAAAKRSMKDLGLDFGGGSGGSDDGFGLDVEAELRQGEEVTAAQQAKEEQQQQRQMASSSRNVSSSSSSGLPPPKFSAGSQQQQQMSNSSSNSSTPISTSPVVPKLSLPGAASPEDEEDDSNIDLSKLSARERNQLKRKRKMGAAGGASPATGGDKTRVVDASPQGLAPPANGGLRIKSPSGQGGEAGASPLSPSPAGASPFAPSTGGAATSSASAKEASDLVPASRAEWPFALVAQVLSADLFSPQWEVRHGAALGLRELIRVQGRACGMRIPPELLESRESAVKAEEAGGGDVKPNAGATSSMLSSAQKQAARTLNDQLHGFWAEDMAIRFLSVLSLDRLGDFIFDHVVAPVRETTSQALAALLRVMPAHCVRSTHSVLREMVLQEHLLQDAQGKWARGTTAMTMSSSSAYRRRRAASASAGSTKATRGRCGTPACSGSSMSSACGRKRVAPNPLTTRALSCERRSRLRHSRECPVQYESVAHCSVTTADEGTHRLRDEDDDIRGVAASMLIPVASDVVAQLPDLLPHLLRQLWDCLAHSRDDLSSSLSSVMDLLSVLARIDAVLTIMQTRSTEQRTFKDLVPLLYPYFRHTITSVRASTVKAVQTFLNVPGAAASWVDDRLFRLLFQNMVVEEKPEIRASSASAWASLVTTFAGNTTWLSTTIRTHIDSFFAILMTPLGQRFDASLFFRPALGVANGHDLDKKILAQDLALVGVDTVMRGRLGAAQALGEVLALWSPDNVKGDFEPHLALHLASQSTLQRCLAAAVLQEASEASARHGRDFIKVCQTAQTLNAQMIRVLEAPPPSTYSEMTVLLLRTHTECQALCNMFVRDGKLSRDVVPTLPAEVDPTGQDPNAFSIEAAKTLAGQTYPTLIAKISKRTQKTALPLLEQKYRVVVASIGFYDSAKTRQDTQMLASLASAVIALGALPDKLNPIIRSVMNSIKFEENLDLQERSARAVAHLIEVCCRPEAKSNPSGKIVKNLCAFVCQDTTITPVFDSAKATLEGIPSIKDLAMGSTKEEQAEVVAGDSEGRLIRRGAQVALNAVAKHFGAALFIKVPALWDGVAAGLLNVTAKGKVIDLDNACAEGAGQSLLDCMHVLQAILPSISEDIHSDVLALLPKLTVALQSKYAIVRSSAAQTIGALAVQSTSATMLHIINEVFPLLNDATSVRNRQGATEAVAITVRKLGLDVLPYLIFMIVPLLGRMADADNDVRLLATSSFGALVKIVPLEAGLPDPVGFPSQLLERRQEQRTFLEQLLGNNKVQPYTIPVPLNVELRKYQHDGVSWMAFLAKYQLHGVLCDDMGLGKTLQTIAIVASKHYERSKQHEETGSIDTKHLPSIVVCPPTLTGHWVHEIRKYATNLRPLLYGGLPAERNELLREIPKHDVVVMSYDVVRNDSQALSDIAFNYCVLDEGHIIKNAKTKTTKAVKAIKANHRLLLSGTPIQNSVLELWSLFDFLMPGFLGTEKAFHERFSKPILATRDGKASAKEREAAALALEALHKQVLPFVLRRLKDDVLDDLPPKIIQDIECELGDIQRELYDDYQRTQKLTTGGESESAGGDEKQHVFQTLQYLRKLVNHPMLVMDPKNPKHLALKQKADKAPGGLQSITHAPKLQALR